MIKKVEADTVASTLDTTNSVHDGSTTSPISTVEVEKPVTVALGESSISADFTHVTNRRLHLLQQKSQSQLNEDLSSTDKDLSLIVTSTTSVGILAGDEDDTASVFSFESYEEKGRKFIFSSDAHSAPIPSEEFTTLSFHARFINMLPYQCLFFTLKEIICMIMSALGCAVFFTGLVFLCMYLEGSWFEEK